MIRKEYKYGNEAREAIKRVAENIGDTLGKTLGPAGRNYQTPEGITNDGRSILSHIRFADECEDNVALAFHEVANRTDADVGDGTTTATVIATELVKNLIGNVPDLDSPTPGSQSVMDMARQLEEEKDRAIQLLSAKAVPVETLEQLEQVAFTSMEDREVAKLIAKTVFEAGKDSFTAIEEGFSGKMEVNIQAGIEMPIRLNYGTHAQASDSPVLVVNHLFEDYRELTPFLQDMVEFMNREKAKFDALIIVAKKFSIPFMQRVAESNQKSPLQIICLSNDHLSDDIFEDIAAFVDSKYVDLHPKGGKKANDLRFESNCGMVSKMVATPKGVVFYGGKGTILNPVQETTRVQARILQITAQMNEEKDAEKRKAMAKRIAEFSGGKATIYVDAKTAAEKYYLKLKVQDCMNSCKTALEGGMVKGGGETLSLIGEELGSISLLGLALTEPWKRIQQNAGGTLEIADDVMDSYLCVKAGVENAVSVVKTVLTLEGIIADAPQSMVEELKRVINE